MLNFELCCQGIMGLYVSPCIMYHVSCEVYIISPRCTTIGSPPNYIWAFLCFLCSLLLAEARSLTLPYAISIVLNIYHWSGAGPLGVLLPAGLIYNTKWGLGTSTLNEEDPPWRSVFKSCSFFRMVLPINVYVGGEKSLCSCDLLM